ncbi:MAG: PaaI family thioesterase [Acidimicrobiia bacterium]|nr:PaaI family thioesterase [Acidimicrobiia bacterium]
MSDSIDPMFPLREYLGFSVEPGEGSAWARLELAAHHHNPNGVAHGAVPFALMDTAMGAAVMSVIDDGQLCATIEIHTRFHRPVSDGTLTAEATVLTSGRRVIHLEARTHDSEDRLVASATGSFAVIDPRPPLAPT